MTRFVPWIGKYIMSYVRDRIAILKTLYKHLHFCAGEESTSRLSLSVIADSAQLQEAKVLSICQHLVAMGNVDGGSGSGYKITSKGVRVYEDQMDKWEETDRFNTQIRYNRVATIFAALSGIAAVVAVLLASYSFYLQQWNDRPFVVLNPPQTTKLHGKVKLLKILVVNAGKRPAYNLVLDITIFNESSFNTRFKKRYDVGNPLPSNVTTEINIECYDRAIAESEGPFLLSVQTTYFDQNDAVLSNFFGWRITEFEKSAAGLSREENEHLQTILKKPILEWKEIGE